MCRAKARYRIEEVRNVEMEGERKGMKQTSDLLDSESSSPLSELSGEKSDSDSDSEDWAALDALSSKKQPQPPIFFKLIF